MLDEIGIILNFDPPAIAFSLELLTALAAPLVTKLYADAMKRQLAGRYLHFAFIAMKSIFRKLPGSVIDLEVALEAQEFHSYWQTAYERALEQVEIKGFRKGLAPKELADQAVDKEKVFEEAAQEAVRVSLNEATQENNWVIIDQPKIEVTHAAPDKGLKYKAQLTVFPEIELGNYKKIAKKVLSEKQEIKIETQEMEKTLNWLRESRAKLTRVSRGAVKGDVIELNLKSYVEGKAIPGGELKNDRLILGESRFLPGFDDELVNHKESEAVDFSLTAPVDYWNRELQSKRVDFKVKVNAVYERELPELNDDFIRGLGPNFSTLAEARTNIESGLKLEKEEKERERLRLKILEEIIKTSKIDMPQIMVDKNLDNMILEVKAMMNPHTKQGVASLTQNNNSPRSGVGVNPGAVNLPKDDELRTQLAPRARERVLANLVMHKITQVEHLEPTKEEVDEEARKLNLDPQTYYDYSYGRVETRKVFEFLERQ